MQAHSPGSLRSSAPGVNGKKENTIPQGSQRRNQFDFPIDRRDDYENLTT